MWYCIPLHGNLLSGGRGAGGAGVIDRLPPGRASPAGLGSGSDAAVAGQKSRIGSITSAMISTRPEMAMTAPTR